MAEVDLSEYRFLVVDDEVFMQSLIVRMLNEAKAAVVLKANDGAQAVRVLASESKPVDCILSDFNMKPVNGLQFLRGIRAGKIPHIPHNQKFLMLTGHGDNEVVAAAIDLDVNGYLVKPVPQEKLIAAVQSTIGRESVVKDVEVYRAKLPKADTQKKTASPHKPEGRTVWQRQKTITDPSLQDKLAEISAAAPKGEAKLSFRNITTRRVEDLEADMVVAEDVFDDHDVLLVAAGTHLTDRFVNKLHGLVDGNSAPMFVKIGEIVS